MSSDATDSQLEMRVSSLSCILKENYNVSNEGLISAVAAIGEATANISALLANFVDQSYAGTQNSSGDDQLKLDIACDEAVFAAIRASGVFCIAASEETPVETDVSGSQLTPSQEDAMYSIGFDPLDGSSIIDANFSVGSIYGVWPGKGVLNRTGREQVVSAIAMYGPRTTLCVALPSKSTNLDKDIVLELTLMDHQTKWQLSRKSISIQPNGNIFAPGNLRATNDNEKYHSLVQHWIAERYTLRYSGGMVPDVYHILIKKRGVFSNVSSAKARAKLRLLYEVAPVGLIIECAGGSTTHESYALSVLDVKIDDLDKRLGVCFGSSGEVDKYKEFMFHK